MHQTPRGACGVGFVAALAPSHHDQVMGLALGALERLEHRGGMMADGLSSDGAGIMTALPHRLLGTSPGRTGVAMLFFSGDASARAAARALLEDSFACFGLPITRYREVPVHEAVLGPEAAACRPHVVQALIDRPAHIGNIACFEARLFEAGRKTRTRLKNKDLHEHLYFASLSARTVVYKALTRSFDLPRFYPDLTHPDYQTPFALFHRRFCTNTGGSWRAAQPFRVVAHNGEINTIAGNRSMIAAREMSLGLAPEELAARGDISDTGTMDETVEALRHGARLGAVNEILAMLMPPAGTQTPFYRFWRRAMEPWDGPALVCFNDGSRVGARLDRNGFRPCRWYRTARHFLLASEAGAFPAADADVLEKGALSGGACVVVDTDDGSWSFADPGAAAAFHDPHPVPPRMPDTAPWTPEAPAHLHKRRLFQVTREDMDRILIPMIRDGAEPIGSMGDTAREAALSDQPRSFFDFFYQNFAQVTNPPLDYLREARVTDMGVHLGRRPNLFAPAELLRAPACLALDGPLLSLAACRMLREAGDSLLGAGAVQTLDATWPRDEGAEALEARMAALEAEAPEAVRRGVSVLLLSDREAGEARVPIPSLLALRAVVTGLNRHGLRLAASVVVDAGDVRETHHVAALVGFGAAAVCPYLSCETARFAGHARLAGLDADAKEAGLLRALSQGLLKIMAKVGISVVDSYRSAKLFTPVGLDQGLVARYFQGLASPIGGTTLQDLAVAVLRRTRTPEPEVLHTYQYKEHHRGLQGEKHAMTSQATKLLHALMRDGGDAASRRARFDGYRRLLEDTAPVHPRHLLSPRLATSPLPLDQVEPVAAVTARFGAGAMSFGAVSAEAQRDIFVAMSRLGGRSNSGEGGENPFYYSHGIEADIKQIASGRFGVTAEYLMGGQEIQIKMAQGAKPGEGGQLMGIKVTPDIARARHALPGIDLISPPPMHDIYSIEDLAGLIYELKQLKPGVRISLKLAAGTGIGTIAVGAVKAGADVLHISGGDGGTGAAGLSSMKHAGLAWELGLVAAHRALCAAGLRERVTLRVDGGLHLGRDVVLAALLGAQGYDFGKLLLVAEGCVMARICEKNTCPTGIATHDPKFRAKYKGRAEDIVTVMTLLAEDVRRILAEMGQTSLEAVIGRADLLHLHPAHADAARAKGLDLSLLLTPAPSGAVHPAPAAPAVGPLNAQIVADAWAEDVRHKDQFLDYRITVRDRGVPATLSGLIALERRARRVTRREAGQVVLLESGMTHGKKHLCFRGHAGQGFGAFLEEGLTLELVGEANDGVGKSLSGGKIIVHAAPDAAFEARRAPLIGNVALYGATRGTLLVAGRAGDRFAVRNSGAVAVAEGAGLHACEYMTGGTVVLLGPTGANLGAGMTGGRLFLYEAQTPDVHPDYLAEAPLTQADEASLRMLLLDYHQHTAAASAAHILDHWNQAFPRFRKFLPNKEVPHPQTADAGA